MFPVSAKRKRLVPFRAQARGLGFEPKTRGGSDEMVLMGVSENGIPELWTDGRKSGMDWVHGNEWAI